MLQHLAFDAGTFVGINPGGGGCLSDVHLRYVRISFGGYFLKKMQKTSTTLEVVIIYI